MPPRGPFGHWPPPVGFWRWIFATFTGTVGLVVRLDMELNGSGGGWTNVYGDCLARDDIELDYGLPGSEVIDRVAKTGTLGVTLDNSESNSAGLLGYYSMDHANKRAGFAIGIHVRLVLNYRGIDYFPLRGTLVKAEPDAGVSGPRGVRCLIVDWMDEVASTKVRGVALQVNKRSDQIFTAIVDAIGRAPAARDVQTGQDTYEYALDNIQDESVPAAGLLQDLAQSELGWIYVRSDTSQGGTLVYADRHFRSLKTTDETTFTDSMEGLTISRAREKIINKVQAIAYPRKVGSTIEILFTLQSELGVPPGESRTFFAPYTDPAHRATRIGGTEMVAPVATTDFLANSASAGGGTNLTNQVTVTAVFGGNGATVTVTNATATPSQTAYLGPPSATVKLELRGKSLIDYGEAIAEAKNQASIDSYGEHLLTLRMPLQTKLTVADSAATYIVSKRKDPISDVDGLAFTANRSNALMLQALQRTVSDRIKIVETVSGISQSFYIQSVKMALSAGNILRVQWGLSPADTDQYWRLGISGASELNQTTRLAY